MTVLIIFIRDESTWTNGVVIIMVIRVVAHISNHGLSEFLFHIFDSNLILKIVIFLIVCLFVYVLFICFCFFQNELKDVEEKFRKAMVANASMDNEKSALTYQVELLKDQLEEFEKQ